MEWRQHISARITSLIILLVASTIGLAQTPAPEAPDEDYIQDLEIPTLLKLIYISYSARTRTEVEVKNTPLMEVSPEAGKMYERIGIEAGDSILAEKRPADRTISLFRGQGKERAHICILRIRYYLEEEDVWRPKFQLYQEALFVPRQTDPSDPSSRQWAPANIVPGVTEPLMITTNAIANAEGYYPRLEFSVGAGRVTLDSWQIH